MLPDMDVGDRIRKARSDLGLTQKALAEAIGVDKSAVAQWEGGGGGKGIKLENLVLVARVLQIRPSDLLGENTESDAMVLTDTREMALVGLYRRLSPTLKDIHLRLLYEQTGAGQPTQAEGNPKDRRGRTS